MFTKIVVGLIDLLYSLLISTNLFFGNLADNTKFMYFFQLDLLRVFKINLIIIAILHLKYCLLSINS